jgi:hypothetical protein
MCFWAKPPDKLARFPIFSRTKNPFSGIRKFFRDYFSGMFLSDRKYFANNALSRSLTIVNAHRRFKAHGADKTDFSN